MKKLFKFWKKPIGKIVAIVLVIGVILLIRSFSSGEEVEVIEDDNYKKVEVSSVKEIIGENSSLNLVGRVESESESQIKTESQGEISGVYKKLSDNVFAGEIIAEIENSSQRANVLSAEASLSIAKANLEKIRDSSGDNVDLIKNSIRQSFTTADDSIRNKVDQFFENSNNRFPNLQFSFGDYFKKEDIENERYEIEKKLEAWKVDISNLNNLNNTSDLQKIILDSQDRISSMQNFLDEIAFALSSANTSSVVSQADINKYSSDVSSARNSLSSSLSSLINSYNNLSSSVDFGVKGQDILISEANVDQARAGLLLAQSSLEKTIIRSPITGKINSINIKMGGFVSTFQDIAEVIGGNNVEIKTFITKSEIDKLKVGTEVLIDKEYKGKIYKIAPSINSQTQKIEIIIIPTESSGLKNGQSVSLSVDLDSKDFSNEKIMVPLKSIKINSDGNFILMIDPENKIYFKSVEIGEIVGENIIINEGLSFDDIIVIDARGLKEGQIIKTN